MVASCFSGDCGLCSGCSGDAGNKVVLYLHPGEFYKEDTGKDPPPPPPAPRDTWSLYKKMLQESDIYRIHGRDVLGRWGRLCRVMIRRWKLMDIYNPGGVFDMITDSHIEFLEGCTEEGVVYGGGRCLKPKTEDIHSIIHCADVDINAIAGKVVISGGGFFDLDALRKQMNLNDEDYEECFDKFQTYMVEVNDKMKEYGALLFRNDCRGKVPEFIMIGCEKYTYSEDDRIMCDDPECSLMGHCMVNWDENNNYMGSRPPTYDSYYYGKIIATIPKYTRNMEHELCLTCALKASTRSASKGEVE